MRGRLDSLRSQIGLRTRGGRYLALVRPPPRLSATDVVLLGRALDGMRDYNRLICGHVPGARLLELEGVIAAIVPAAPCHPALNNVVYERAPGLRRALDEVATAYDDAGVSAWLIWAPAVDGEARRMLWRAGYRLDPSPTVMARELASFERPDASRLTDWTASGEPAVMAAIADRAFEFDGAFIRTLGTLPASDGIRIYVARIDGEPVSCVMTSDQDENCAVDMVATVPEATGRGLSSALVSQALADAAERGRETTTLVATPVARALYQRLGYRALCALHQWERSR